MKQTIQEAVASVQNAPGSMYTREDVISLLNRIKVEKGSGPTDRQIKDLVERIVETVNDNASSLSTDDVLDTYSAEFELNGNEISLSSVDIDCSKIADEVTDGIESVIEEFFEELNKEDDEEDGEKEEGDDDN